MAAWIGFYAEARPVPHSFPEGGVAVQEAITSADFDEHAVISWQFAPRVVQVFVRSIVTEEYAIQKALTGFEPVLRC